MTWFPDMGHATMVPLLGDHVRAIGWLHPDHPYPCGTVPAAFQARLEAFARLASDSTVALALPVAHGYHICEFCNDARGWRNFGVPAENVLFVAPELVAHYVSEHTYTPPAEFVAAVLASPLPDTPEYRAAVAGFREIHKRRQREMLQRHP
jgi:hypothetical protein